MKATLTPTQRGHLALCGYRIESALGMKLPSMKHIGPDYPMVYLAVAALLWGENVEATEDGVPSYKPSPKFLESVGLCLARMV